MKDLTLQLPDELESELAEISRREHRPPGEVALDLLAGSVRARRFQQLRRESLEALGPDAAPTDQQAFDEIS
jgi:predicted transcriptional regulator